MKFSRMLISAPAAAAASVALCMAPALAGPNAEDEQGATAPQSVQTRFSDEEIAIMAKTSGRTEAQQRGHLAAQEKQNNAYADLFKKGHRYDGAYFNKDNKLVLQAKKGSPAAKAAEAQGLTVTSPQFGEQRLSEITEALTKSIGKDADVASISPDVIGDTVVVTVVNNEGQATVDKLAAKYGDAVTVQRGEANVMQRNVAGGDKMDLGGGYCSAGFGANDGTQNFMVWAGHCLEGIDEVHAEDGTLVGHQKDTKFVSYDGQTDKDMGIVELADGVTMDGTVNDHGEGKIEVDATKGAWKAPIGTDACKSGATSGITCGKVTGYDATVTYSDHQGRVQAQVVGLGEASICTAPGDSGGAYVSGGYAIGMTSGGPAGQECGFNGGYVEGSSYFQPVTDALEEYGLEYGNIGASDGGGEDTDPLQ